MPPARPSRFCRRRSLLCFSPQLGRHLPEVARGVAMSAFLLSLTPREAAALLSRLVSAEVNGLDVDRPKHYSDVRGVMVRLSTALEAELSKTTVQAADAPPKKR